MDEISRNPSDAAFYRGLRSLRVVFPINRLKNFKYYVNEEYVYQIYFRPHHFSFGQGINKNLLNIKFLKMAKYWGRLVFVIDFTLKENNAKKVLLVIIKLNYNLF